MQLLAGIALIASAGLADRALLRAPRAPGSGGEPIALTLAPLGPIKAVVSSALWVALVDSQLAGDERRIVTIARALLEVHPGLAIVREYLANQLIVTEAPAAQTDEQHDALVMLGLELLGDGLALSDDARLHSALGRTLAVQRDVDKRFAPAAERFLGCRLEDVAIDSLARSATPIDHWLCADLLVERGLDAAGRGGNRWSAVRDLRAAEHALAGIDTPGEDEADAAARLLQPLREALAAAEPDGP